MSRRLNNSSSASDTARVKTGGSPPVFNVSRAYLHTCAMEVDHQTCSAYGAHFHRNSCILNVNIYSSSVLVASSHLFVSLTFLLSRVPFLQPFLRIIHSSSTLYSESFCTASPQPIPSLSSSVTSPQFRPVPSTPSPSSSVPSPQFRPVPAVPARPRSSGRYTVSHRLSRCLLSR